MSFAQTTTSYAKTGRDMDKSSERSLSQYISQIMNLKGFSAADVAERSGKEITAGYVTGLMKGTAKNPSVEKINALAGGLGIDNVELFRAACKLPSEQQEGKQVVDPSYTLVILELMRKVAVEPVLAEMLNEMVRLSPEERLVVLDSLRALNRNRPVSGRSKKNG